MQSYMEAALKTISNLGNIWNIHILCILIVVFGKLEVHFLSEEEFQEEFHDLCILLLVEVFISKHGDTSAHYQLTSWFLMLINSANRPVARISEWSWGQDWVRWREYIYTGAVNKYKVNTSPLWFFLIFLLIFLSPSQHKSIVPSPFWLFSIAVCHSCDFLIENSIVDISLFRMEVFIKGCSDDTIRIYNDSKFFSQLRDICIVSKYFLSYFLSPP